tara:strand:- start:40397 stop:41239 length:843 start_codon:yes stop_codon:yes gene_type:complete
MIKLFKTNEEYFNWHEKNQQKTIGFAPTMGNIHNAHLSLLEQALIENEVGIISIYVNPTQFGEGEDFDAYPRTLSDDIEKIKTLESKYNKDIIIYAPRETDIYPQGFTNYLKAHQIAADLEGDLRPTHFDGVVTVVARLFEIIKPHKSYFGKKDYQQLKLIELMAREHYPQVEVKGMPIIREPNGLAMSSRNNYLSPAQKDEALALRNSLLAVSKEIEKGASINEIKELIQNLKTDKKLNYLDLKSAIDFSPLNEIKKPIVILGNYQIGSTRLLDNVEVL